MCLQEVEYLVDDIRLLFLMMDSCFLRLVGIDVCIMYGYSHIEPFIAEIFLSQTNCHALFQCFCITFVSQSEYEAVPASRFEFSNPLYCEYRLVEFHPFPRLSFRLILYHLITYHLITLTHRLSTHLSPCLRSFRRHNTGQHLIDLFHKFFIQVCLFIERCEESP